MKQAIVLCLLIVILGVAGCSQFRKPSDSALREAVTSGSSIESKAARDFSDSVVKVILEDRYLDLRQKMEQAFRDEVSKSDMELALERVFSVYGKPFEAEFKSDTAGYRLYDNGNKKPLRKDWYVVRTPMHEKGKHFLFTEIVPDGESLACAVFSIVAYQGEEPPWLR